MAKKKKKDNIEFEVGLDGTITNHNENKNINNINNIEFEVGLDGAIKKNNINSNKVKKENKKQYEKKDDSFLEASKKMSDTFKNSAIKNHGFNVSNAITDIANVYDATKNMISSVPVAGKVFKANDVAKSTAKNIATNMAEGALRTGEGILDFANNTADTINNKLSYEAMKKIYGKTKADKWYKNATENSKKNVEKDLTSEFLKKTGFNNQEFHNDFEKESLVKKDNLGGQIAQGIGGMVPSLLVGQYTGLGEITNTSTKGMKLEKKILTTAGNLGKQTSANLGSTAILGASSYGQALQEAFQNGATNEEARKYALGSSATELATEWITGGIPGLENTGIVDKTAKQLIDKSTGKVKNEVIKGITKTLLNAGYEIAGEGFEEGLSEIISPLLKNATYSKGEKVNWNDVFQSALVGGITGGILNTPSTITNFKNNVFYNKDNLKSNNVMPSINTVSNSNSIQENPLIQENIPINMPTAISNKNSKISLYTKDNDYNIRDLYNQETQKHNKEDILQNHLDRQKISNEDKIKKTSRVGSDNKPYTTDVMSSYNDNLLQNDINVNSNKSSINYSTQKSQNNISKKELNKSFFSSNKNILKNYKDSLFSKKNIDDINIKKLSNDLVEEIHQKTKNNIKKKENVKMVPIEELLHFKKNGGYRISEDMTKLSNNIIANGIETPIEITKENGNIEIYNGNHRLMIAEKLGLKEVPVILKDSIVDNYNFSYNKDIDKFYKGEEDGNFTRTKKFEESINQSKFNVRNSSTDSKQSNIEQGISRDGRLSNSLSRYNDRTSSNSAFAEDDASKNSKQELDNLSFSSNKNKDTTKWKNFLENNFKSDGTKTKLNDIKYVSNNTEQSLIDKKTDTLKKQYEKEKTKTKKYITKEASKILEFSDYKTKQKFTELISEYYDNPNREKIKQDILDNFSEKRIEYLNEELADIKKQIRTTDLKIDDYVKRNMIDYNSFRKDNFSKLKLKKEGQSIDSFYTEMSELYPNIFKKDITNEIDQLNRLSEFMNEDISIIEKYNLDDKVVNKATDYIYDSLKNKENIDELISSISISPKEIRKEKNTELREFASEFLEDSSDWKDKKSGLAYKINTMKRNFYDIMGKKDAERLYKNFIEPIFNHNAQVQTEISNYNNKIKKLKLDKNESIAVQMFGELKYNPGTLVTQMQVDEFIEKNKLDYDKISKSVEVFREVYDDLLKKRNEVLKSMGYKEIDYRKGYFPHFVENKPSSLFGKTLEKIGWKFNDNSIPTSIAGITEQFKPGKIWTSSSQQRMGKYTDYNALKGFDNYIRDAMNEIYFTEDIQKLRALENEIRYQHSDKGIQNKIDEIQSDNSLTFEEKQDKIDKIYTNYITPLNNFVTELRDYTNGLANKKSGLDRTVESLSNRKFYNTMNNISSRLSANMVGLNLGSAITNFIPITQATSQVKSKYLLKGLKESIKSQYSTDGFESKSVFLTTRLNEAERLYKTSLEKASGKANIIFDSIDSITANTIVRGKYYENLSKGMTEFNAMRNADEFARDLMAGRGKGEMPTAFNSKNPIVKAFTAFQLETANQFGYMFKDLPRDMEDEAKNKLATAFLKMFVGAWIYNQLTEKIVGRKAAFSPVDTIKEIFDTSKDEDLKITEKSSKILENLTSDIPFVGGLVGGGRLPISSAANPIKIIKGESTLKDEAKKAFYYTVMPFGGGQIKKTIEGASMYINNKDVKGSYNKKGELRFEAKKDPLSVAQNLLFGQYSSKNARNYFKNNYMPISKETMKRLKENNISINQYRDYEDKYNSIKNSKGEKIKEIVSDKDSSGKTISGSATAKKAYLIMKSKFSTKEKNYMLSKLNNFKSNDENVKTLTKLDNNKKTYKLYYSLSKENRKKFINEIDNFNISVSELTDFYNMKKDAKKENTSIKTKEMIIEYINNSNLDEDTKWYLYSKDYGNDKLNSQVKEFNIKTKDYFNVINYKNFINNKYPGENNSKRRKNEIFSYINNLHLNKTQKIILFNQAGYSNVIGKNTIYNYVNSKTMSKQEKEKLFKELY